MDTVLLALVSLYLQEVTALPPNTVASREAGLGARVRQLGGRIQRGRDDWLLVGPSPGGPKCLCPPSLNPTHTQGTQGKGRDLGHRKGPGHREAHLWAGLDTQGLGEAAAKSQPWAA